jgi:hypothetical protein
MRSAPDRVRFAGSICMRRSYEYAYYLSIAMIE